jgi:hypothetical protein
MTTPLPDTVAGLIDEAPTSEKTLLVVNRTGPAQLQDLLDRAFRNQSITVADRQLPKGPENLVCLVHDGEVTATTPFAELEEAFLLVNADRYRTGTRQLTSGSFPDVLTGLDEVEFTLRGFPASNKEKLLLVLISRFIEARALERGAGEFHSTFQRLSRLDDEYGTRAVYEWLAESAVDTHIYGVPDDPTAAEATGVTVHAGTSGEYRHSWVVVYTPPEDGASEATGGHSALVAVETGPNVWRSTWTYDPGRVTRIQSYVRQHLQSQ